MSYFVYILRSRIDHKLYVGCTSNFDKRIKLHNSGRVESTKNRYPLDTILVEEYNDKSQAFNRERFLKSLWSTRFKRKLLLQFNKDNFAK